MQDTRSDEFWGLQETRWIFSPPRIDRELVTNFFMVFARAEYALKRAGYVTGDRNGRLQIEWDKFASTIKGRVFDTGLPKVDDAIAYLQKHPPQKQVLRNETLDWEDRTSKNQRDPVFLIRSLTTVRNNLFHGGKEITGLLAERDRALLQSSLVLLSYIVGLDRKVLRAFKELPQEQYAA